MKLFGKDEDNYYRLKKSDGFENMLKIREENLPDYEREIEKALRNYDGGLVGIVRVFEDENGEPNSATEIAVGTASLSSQMALVGRLRNMADELEKKANAALEAHRKTHKEPEMEELVEEILENFLKDIKKGKN